MPLEPLHPDEQLLHHELRDALNRSLTNTSFFVWIDVVPSGGRRDFDDLEGIVAETERWLATLDPDDIEPTDLPEREFSDEAGHIRVRAIPKKRAARDHRAAEIVGNPEPALAGWV